MFRTLSMRSVCALVAAALMAACSSGTGPTNGNSNSAQRLAVGDGFSCALDHTGQAWCWGEGDLGELGNVSRTGSATSVRVDGGPYKSLAAAGSTVCGLRSNGSVDCWGQLIPGCCSQTSSTVDAPIPMVSPVQFSQLSLGFETACGIARTGDAYCWGTPDEGSLGNDAQSDTVVSPVRVAGGHGFTSVSESFLGGCGIDPSGVAWCWGADLEGELGIDDSTFDSTATAPVAVSGGVRFTQLSAGAAYMCGITTTGGTSCWGYNGSGQLGTGDTDDRTVPTPVSAARFVTVYAPANNSVLNHTCALDASGAAWCWGDNRFGELGAASNDMCFIFGSGPCALTPVAVQGGLRFSTLAVSSTHTCAMIADGHVYCWGSDNNGQLGDGGNNFSMAPVLAQFTP
jgi:alpha-tubulin suppressor-like RCC1 family protein